MLGGQAVLAPVLLLSVLHFTQFETSAGAKLSQERVRVGAGALPSVYDTALEWIFKFYCVGPIGTHGFQVKEAA